MNVSVVKKSVVVSGMPHVTLMTAGKNISHSYDVLLDIPSIAIIDCVLNLLPDDM